MNTHPETIQVPDGWTIANTSDVRDGQGHILVRLKPVPPPEPPIKPCPFCGEEVGVHMTGDCQSYVLFHRVNGNLCAVRYMQSYPTRAAAIEAANRRAG